VKKSNPDNVYRSWEYARHGDYHRNLDPNWSYTPTYLRKMTFIKFNSGKWFNAELSIYLMDAYPFPLNPAEQVKE